jgi:hypothetical protein
MQPMGSQTDRAVPDWDRGARARDQLAGAALVKARPWDVIGAALGVPMLLWGLLGWFGTVGDASGGTAGFFSGTGAAGIALVLAAAALTAHQVLSGRAHTNIAPPVAVLLAGAAAVMILGGLLAKPDSTTIEAGAIAGLLTALSQGATLTVGWIKGSGKAVRAARMAAWTADQQAADVAAAARAAQPAVAIPGQQGYPPPGFYGYPGPVAQPSRYPQQQGYPLPQGYPQQQGYPPPPPAAGSYPPPPPAGGSYPPPPPAAGSYPPPPPAAGSYPPPVRSAPPAPGFNPQPPSGYQPQ